MNIILIINKFKLFNFNPIHNNFEFLGKSALLKKNHIFEHSKIIKNILAFKKKWLK